MKKYFEYTLVLVCLVPLFFINIKTSHDWGDDFALYIKQAKNINAGISQNETGYIFNETCYIIAPQAYPTGFPLLLSLAVDDSSDINYSKLNLYITLFLALTCFVGFLILRNYFSYIAAFAVTLIIAYNPILLQFKTEILSDLPFAFFSMLSIYLMLQKQNYFTAVLLGIVIGFSIHIRSIGFVLMIVFVLQKFFIENSIRKISLKIHLHTLISIAVCVLFYFVIKYSFPVNSKYISFFDTENDFWNVINNHFSYNVSQLALMFRNYKLEDYAYIGVIASSCLVAFGLFGFIYFFKQNKRSVINVYVAAYLFVIISYRYSEAGMRFLFPVLFFIFVCAGVGLKQILSGLNVNNRVVALIVGGLILFSYKDEVEKIIYSENEIADGPESPEAQAVFQFINNSLPEKTVIVFPLPKVLALYTHANSVSFNCTNTDEDKFGEIKKFQVNYILNAEDLTAEHVKHFTLQDTTMFKPVFANTRFTLFQVIK